MTAAALRSEQRLLNELNNKKKETSVSFFHITVLFWG